MNVNYCAACQLYFDTERQLLTHKKKFCVDAVPSGTDENNHGGIGGEAGYQERNELDVLWGRFQSMKPMFSGPDGDSAPRVVAAVAPASLSREQNTGQETSAEPQKSPVAAAPPARVIAPVELKEKLLIMRLQELAQIKRSEQKVLTDLESSLRNKKTAHIKLSDLRNTIEESRLLLENLTTEEADIRREIYTLRNPETNIVVDGAPMPAMVNQAAVALLENVTPKKTKAKPKEQSTVELNREPSIEYLPVPVPSAPNRRENVYEPLPSTLADELQFNAHPMLKEIGDMDRAYVLSGGRDEQIRNQMRQLAKEVQEVVDQIQEADKDWKEMLTRVQRHVQTYEDENSKLVEHIRTLEEEKKKIPAEPDGEKELHLMKMEHKRRLLQLQFEREELLLKREVDAIKKQKNWGMHTEDNDYVEFEEDTDKFSMLLGNRDETIIYCDFVRAKTSQFEIDSETQIDVVLGVFDHAGQIGQFKAILSDRGQREFDGAFFITDNFYSFSANGKASPTWHLVAELRFLHGGIRDAQSFGWAVFDLFTEESQLSTGFWCVNIFPPPIYAYSSMGDLTNTKCLSNIELFIRIYDSTNNEQKKLKISPSLSLKYLKKKIAPNLAYRESRALKNGQLSLTAAGQGPSQGSKPPVAATTDAMQQKLDQRREQQALAQEQLQQQQFLAMQQEQYELQLQQQQAMVAAQPQKKRGWFGFGKKQNPVIANDPAMLMPPQNMAMSPNAVQPMQSQSVMMQQMQPMPSQSVMMQQQQLMQKSLSPQEQMQMEQQMQQQASMQGMQPVGAQPPIQPNAGAGPNVLNADPAAVVQPPIFHEEWNLQKLPQPLWLSIVDTTELDVKTVKRIRITMGDDFQKMLLKECAYKGPQFQVDVKIEELPTVASCVFMIEFLGEGTKVLFGGALPITKEEENVPFLNMGTHAIPLKNIGAINATEPSIKLAWYPKRFQLEDAQSIEENIEIPRAAWIPVAKKVDEVGGFAADPLNFSISIDGARFLPANVYFSKVTGALLDENFYPIEKTEISTKFDLDTEIQMPLYLTKQEFKLETVIPSAILMLKVFGIEKKTLQMQSIGFTMINIYDVPVIPPEGLPPDVPPPILKLNEGAFQLPIFIGKVDVAEQLTMESCKKYKRLPCATILIRIGPLLDAENDFPLYKDGIYDSTRCQPERHEVQLYLDLVENRSELTYRAALEEIEIQFTNTENALSYISSKFVKGGLEKIGELDMSYVAKYMVKRGLKISIDGAQNLNKKKPTLAIASICPPAALYDPLTKEPPTVNNVHLVKRLNLESAVRSPTYADGFWKWRPEFSERLMLIIDLRAVSLSKTKDEILPQGWTALPLFNKDGFANHGFYQLPLYEGTPTRPLILQMVQTEQEDIMKTLESNQQIRPILGATVFVRICDARRTLELEGLPLEQANKRYIYFNAKKYMKAGTSDRLDSTLPKKVDPVGYMEYLVDVLEESVIARANDELLNKE